MLFLLIFYVFVDLKCGFDYKNLDYQHKFVQAHRGAGVV